jgi:pimeloyl-ACP methyl ester carboxylesterase
MGALADAGYRAVALDLRGYGASDKPPRGYDTWTSARDVASVLRSLGESSGVIVGHGWGAWVAWSMPSLQPAVTRAIGSLSMPHPRVFRRAAFHSAGQVKANSFLLGLQRPFVPERQMTVNGGFVHRVLREWASPEGIWPSLEEADRYAEAMAMPFVAHSAAEYYRWLVRSQVRPDGWRFARQLAAPIAVPVLQLHGEDDSMVLPEAVEGCEAYAADGFERHFLPRAGHFLPEEASERVSRYLLDWLERAAPTS